MNEISASVAAFMVAVTLLLALRPLAVAVGMVDKPGGRKTHHGEIPVIGGLAMFAALLVAAIGGEQIGHQGAMMLTASAFMVLLGALDDKFDLPPRVRLFAHLAAAIALVYGTRFQVSDLGNLFGTGELSLGWLSLPFTVVSCVALINAFNMLDGLDGLAGGVSLVSFGAVAVLATLYNAPTSLLIASSMVGALVAFLLFNMPVQFNRGVRTFMGDAGSTLLGFVLAGVGLTLIQPTGANIAPVVILWLMPIPIFELFTSTIRRMVNGLSPAAADTGHFHHVLVQAGFSVRAVFATYLLFSVCCAVVGVKAADGSFAEPLLFAGFGALFLGWVWFVRNAHFFAALLPQPLRREGERAH